MNSTFVLYLLLGALAGGFINGFSGTGTALFALGFFLVVLEPVTAVAVVALLAVLAGLQGLWLVKDEIFGNLKLVLVFVLPGLVGVPIGVALLSHIDASALRLLIAALLVSYGAYFGFRNTLPKLDKPGAISDACIGLLGGLLGGLASLSGALPSIWLSLRAWPKARIRAVLQTYNVVILSSTVVLLSFKGAYTQQSWIALAIALPVGLLAAQTGIALFKRISDQQFRRTLILLCLCLGVGLFAREWQLY